MPHRNSSWIHVPLTALFAFLLGPVSHTFADSPLTNTPFSSAYLDSPLVQAAAAMNDGDPVALFAALSDESLAHDLRAAIINALPWSPQPRDRALAYAHFLATAKEIPRPDLSLSDLNPAEVFALGYLLAMDDYTNLGPLGGPGELATLTPLRLLNTASLQAPGSYTVHLIGALVLAQQALRNDWCQVYRVVAAVNERFPDRRDLRPDAVNVVTRYIDLYRTECPRSRPVKGP